MVGYNLHGLQFLQRELEAREGVQLFMDATKLTMSSEVITHVTVEFELNVSETASVSIIRR